MNTPLPSHAPESAPLTREMQMAWSLREDIRAGRDIDDPEARLDFRLWWLTSAAREFPAVARPPQAEDAALAGEVIIPAAGAEDAAITRLMDFIRRLRPKEAAGFDVATPQGRRALAAWHYACVVPELSLFPLLDARERCWLLEPVTPPLAPAGLPLPRLVRLTWENRTDVRQTFDLSQPGGTWALLSWYWIYGAAEMGHQAYAAWLSARELFSPCSELGGLPRMALFAWQADDAQRARIDPTTPAGKTALAAWLEETRTLPRLAQALLEAPAEHACPPPPPPPPAHSFGANVIGYARGELGIGEDSRMCALALSQAEVPFAVVNIPVGSNTREQDTFLDACLVEDTPYPVNIFCLTGLDTARMWLERGEALFSGRKNVGYWPWELPAWPEAMADAYALVDELWVSSAYTRDAFAKSAPVPVRLMPMAVSVDRVTPRPREYFGLPGNRFLFLYTLDCNSYLARKNPLAVIRAFRGAFPRGTEPVALVLKTMNAREDDPRWSALASAAAADARIVFLHGTMDRGDVLGLFAACDAYVSPHRAEGFGRTLAEAMLLGKPVIATGYSGNADFLTPETGYPVPYRFVPIGEGEYPFGQGLVWAEPDADALAGAMRRVADAPEEAARRARAGRDLVAGRHHPLEVGRAYRERLEALCR